MFLNAAFRVEFKKLIWYSQILAFEYLEKKIIFFHKKIGKKI